MSIPSDLTYDLSPSRRPGISDVGGAAYLDDATYPPDPDTMPSADALNQWQRQIVALAKVAPVARLSVAWDGSSYLLTQVQGCGANVVAGAFTLTRIAAGHCRIEWATDLLPASAGAPAAALNKASAITSSAAIAASLTLPTQLDVYIVENGVATDLPFVVEIH